MGERGFAEPVRVEDIEDSQITTKPSRLDGQELRLMWLGAILGGVTVLLFGVALLVMGVL